MDKTLLREHRSFLMNTIWKHTDFSETDQSIGLPLPPIEKPCLTDARRIDLPRRDRWKSIVGVDLATAIARRRSRRAYRKSPLSIEEVAFLLWTTQGLRGRVAEGQAHRTVPSAGCRHVFETYLAVLDVRGLDRAIYRYLPLSHQVLFERSVDNLAQRLAAAAFGQTFVGGGAVTLIWAAIPYRMEWRYGLAAHKMIAIDAGHVCQNLYLACEAIGAGTCAVAAYDQEAMDDLVGLDGKDEFTIYLAPVGKVGPASGGR